MQTQQSPSPHPTPDRFPDWRNEELCSRHRAAPSQGANSPLHSFRDWVQTARADTLPPPNPGVPGFGHFVIGPSRKHPTWTSGGEGGSSRSEEPGGLSQSGPPPLTPPRRFAGGGEPTRFYP